MIRPRIAIAKEMLDQARSLEMTTQVNRTVTSPYDAVVGLLGEFAVAHYLYGEWRMHQVRDNRGKSDFPNEDIEVKTSAFPFSENLNLLVREDYAARRTPSAYVQVIIDIEFRDQRDINPGTEAVLCGWTTSDVVNSAPLRHMGSKLGDRSGYRCRAVPIRSLNDMTTLPRKAGASDVRDAGRTPGLFGHAT